MVLKNRVTDLLCVMTMADFAVPQKICPISSNDRNIAQRFLAKMNITVCEGVNIFEPYATGEQVLCADVNFCFGSSSVNTSNLAA